MIASRMICFFLASLMALPAIGGETLQPLRSRGELLGWEAIGRLDLAGQGFCTAALIAPDQVLTAAHCVFDETGRQLVPESITFHAGYVSGDALSVREVERIVVDAGYNDVPNGKISSVMMRHDVALLRLRSPILSGEANPFAIYTDPKPGEKVSVLSYGRGRSEHISWQRDCAILQRAGGLLMFDCDVTFGSSGAPVFVRYGNRVRILSLMSAIGEDHNGEKRSYGMELPEIVAELKHRMRVGDASTLRIGSGAKRVQVGVGKSGSSAKFIKVD